MKATDPIGNTDLITNCVARNVSDRPPQVQPVVPAEAGIQKMGCKRQAVADAPSRARQASIDHQLRVDGDKRVF